MAKYKHGDKIVSINIWFKIATFLMFHFIILFPASIVTFMLYRYRIYGRNNLKKVPKAVTVSNHTLFWDPVIIACTSFPKMPYQTLLEATVCAPIVGTLTRLLGGVPIPRRDMYFKSLTEGCETIFKKNNYLHFYPEGECYLYNNVPKRFHSGAFYVSAKLNVPIVPMATVFHKGGNRPVVHLHIMEPVYPEKYNIFNEDGQLNEQNLKKYMKDVQGIISNKIIEENGTGEYFKGALKRIPGINDEE